MKRWSKAIAGGAVLCVLFQLWGFVGASAGIRERVVRLHVMAHDDSEEEQALKLCVRDAVSEKAATLFSYTEDREVLLVQIREALPQLQATAEACVREQGYSHAVQVELTEQYFTTRTYDSGTYPAGVYDTVRVVIGDGAGRNWWCVLYPPLCVAAATKAPSTEEVLTEAQQAVVKTPSYAVRFKVVEWWERLFSRKT